MTKNQTIPGASEWSEIEVIPASDGAVDLVQGTGESITLYPHQIPALITCLQLTILQAHVHAHADRESQKQQDI